MILYCAICAARPILKNSVFCSSECEKKANMSSEMAFRNGDISKNEQTAIEEEEKHPYDPEFDGPLPDEPETKTGDEK